jgi:hypothetical protein
MSEREVDAGAAAALIGTMDGVWRRGVTMQCAIHDARNIAGKCSCSDIVKALRLSDADVEKLKALRKAINRPAYHNGLGAYHGGLGLEESGKYLGLLDRILAAHGARA